jgi:hypothetical protein
MARDWPPTALQALPLIANDYRAEPCKPKTLALVGLRTVRSDFASRLGRLRDGSSSNPFAPTN